MYVHKAAASTAHDFAHTVLCTTTLVCTNNFYTMEAFLVEDSLDDVFRDPTLLKSADTFACILHVRRMKVIYVQSTKRQALAKLNLPRPRPKTLNKQERENQASGRVTDCLWFQACRCSGGQTFRGVPGSTLLRLLHKLNL